MLTRQGLGVLLTVEVRHADLGCPEKSRLMQFV